MQWVIDFVEREEYLLQNHSHSFSSFFFGLHDVVECGAGRLLPPSLSLSGWFTSIGSAP